MAKLTFTPDELEDIAIGGAAGVMRERDVKAIQVIAEQFSLVALDNGVAVVISARSTEPLIGLAGQLTDLKIGGMKNLVPAGDEIRLYVSI